MSKSDKLAAQFGANIASTINLRADSPSRPATNLAGPDKYEGATKSRAFAELPLDRVVCKLQVREEFDQDDLERLALSIKRFGQLAPIRVRPDDDGRWVVLVGERRLRACKLAGLDRVRVEFVEREMSEADILAEQTVENVVRADLKPVEQGRAYKRLMDLNGWNAKELCEVIGVEPTGAYRALALLRLPDDVAEMVDSGEIRATAAYEIAKLQIADDQRAVAEAVVSGDLDHKATVEEVSKRRSSTKASKGKGAGKGKTKLPTIRSLRLDGGYKVTIERAKGIEPESVVAKLREVLAKFEAEQGDGQAAA